MNETTKPTTSDNQHGISVTEVLIALATLATTLLVGAIDEPKIPKGLGD